MPLLNDTGRRQARTKDSLLFTTYGLRQTACAAASRNFLRNVPGESAHRARPRTNRIIKTIKAITRARLLNATWQRTPTAQSMSKATKITQNIILSRLVSKRPFGKQIVRRGGSTFAVSNASFRFLADFDPRIRLIRRKKRRLAFPLF